MYQVENFLFHSGYEDEMSSMGNSFRNYTMEHIFIVQEHKRTVLVGREQNREQ